MKKQLVLAVSTAAFIFSNSAIAGHHGNKKYDKRLYVVPEISGIWSDADRQTSRTNYGLGLGVGKAISENYNVELNP